MINIKMVEIFEGYISNSLNKKTRPIAFSTAFRAMQQEKKNGLDSIRASMILIAIDKFNTRIKGIPFWKDKSKAVTEELIIFRRQVESLNELS